MSGLRHVCLTTSGGNGWGRQGGQGKLHNLAVSTFVASDIPQSFVYGIGSPRSPSDKSRRAICRTPEFQIGAAGARVMRGCRSDFDFGPVQWHPQPELIRYLRCVERISFAVRLQTATYMRTETFSEFGTRGAKNKQHLFNVFGQRFLKVFKTFFWICLKSDSPFQLHLQSKSC
jgi:hypothetical protein